MEATDILAGLHALGFAVAAEGDQLTLTGPLELLDDRRRSLIREAKPELLRLLACPAAEPPCPHCGSTDTGHAATRRWCHACEQPLRRSQFADDFERRTEREAMAFADTPEADEPLADLLSWFELLPHASEVASRCDHDANASRGSWHMLGGRLCCRHCGGFYQAVMARVAESDIKAKSREATTPRLF
jgi:hypothetical protein